RPYVIAYRVRPCPQGGKGSRTARFIQAHYLVSRAGEGVERDVWGLLPQLRADPMTREDSNLQAPEIGSTKPRLPAGGLVAVRPCLRRLLSGEAFAIRDVERAPEAVMETFLRCLACLPAAVRWRVPLAAGLYRVEPSHWGLAHGLKADETTAPGGDKEG